MKALSKPSNSMASSFTLEYFGLSVRLVLKKKHLILLVLCQNIIFKGSYFNPAKISSPFEHELGTHIPKLKTSATPIP